MDTSVQKEHSCSEVRLRLTSVCMSFCQPRGLCRMRQLYIALIIVFDLPVQGLDLAAGVLHAARHLQAAPGREQKDC